MVNGIPYTNLTSTAFQEERESEISSLQQTISGLEAQCKKLAGQRETPLGQNR